MPRPALARIMPDRAVAAGAKIRLGTSATRCAGRDRVDVTFADGSAGRYDLVVGADGIRSATRRMIGIADGAAAQRAWASSARSGPGPPA